MQKEKREYVLVSGHGRWATRSEVTVECVEQRGKFYASMHTLNASPVGIGNTPDEAFEAWGKCYGNAKLKYAHPKPGNVAQAN